MTDDRTIRTMRNMAWERAKGELQAVLSSYWEDKDRYDGMNAEVERFIKFVEDNGLLE